VLRVRLRGAAAEVVGVHEVVVHREVGVAHPGAPVLRGDPPPRVHPRHGDDLAPARGVAPAAVVVVPQDAEPWLALQRGPIVHVVENARPLRRPVQGLQAASLDAAPVEAVADVEDIVEGGIVQRKLVHLICHPLLNISVTLVQLSVLCWRWWIARAAPVSDDKDVVRSRVRNADILQSYAVMHGNIPEWLRVRRVEGVRTIINHFVRQRRSNQGHEKPSLRRQRHA